MGETFGMVELVLEPLRNGMLLYLANAALCGIVILVTVGIRRYRAMK